MPYAENLLYAKEKMWMFWNMQNASVSILSTPWNYPQICKDYAKIFLFFGLTHVTSFCLLSNLYY